MLVGEHLRIEAWIGVDPAKIGKEFNCVFVYPPSWLQGRDAILLAYVRAHGARTLIARQLERMGYRAGRTYWPVG